MTSYKNLILIIDTDVNALKRISGAAFHLERGGEGMGDFARLLDTRSGLLSNKENNFPL
jgi:hypothetical protein